MPHDVDHAAKHDSSVGSRANRFAASRHERRSCYVFGAGMSAEAKAGVPSRTIMDVLGHSAIGVTMNTYAHVVIPLREGAADAIGGVLGE